MTTIVSAAGRLWPRTEATASARSPQRHPSRRISRRRSMCVVIAVEAFLGGRNEAPALPDAEVGLRVAPVCPSSVAVRALRSCQAPWPTRQAPPTRRPANPVGSRSSRPCFDRRRGAAPLKIVRNTRIPVTERAEVALAVYPAVLEARHLRDGQPPCAIRMLMSVSTSKPLQIDVHRRKAMSPERVVAIAEVGYRQP